LPIPGGNYYRSFDGVSSDYDDESFPASVTGFSLDRYEVTVGRFRRFVSAVVAGFRPGAGSGTRTDLNLGKGLVNVGPDGGYDPGWDATWNSELDASSSGWNTNLACVANPTWTAQAGKNEQRPITCVNWYEAFAFCIWDEGRLPTEAEWNEAASGGDEQRVFPWSTPSASQAIDCAHANYFGAKGPDFCVSPGVGASAAVGADSPAGDGRWGQADLAGNVFEWVRDWYAPYSPLCPDCVYIDATPNHVMRGGGFSNAAPDLLASSRAANASGARSGSLGLRCARGL
jgi:formylglycine-generating enzyme required for sulfatase activity